MPGFSPCFNPGINVTTRLLNCGGCYACCQGDAIFLHPEMGDKPEWYDTVEYQDDLLPKYKGRLMLNHKPNGDCVYLDREKGCTIYKMRPVICREFDCVDFYRRFPKNMRSKFMPKGAIKAAQRRIRGLVKYKTD